MLIKTSESFNFVSSNRLNGAFLIHSKIQGISWQIIINYIFRLLNILATIKYVQFFIQRFNTYIKRSIFGLHFSNKNVGLKSISLIRLVACTIYYELIYLVERIGVQGVKGISPTCLVYELVPFVYIKKI